MLLLIILLYLWQYFNFNSNFLIQIGHHATTDYT